MQIILHRQLLEFYTHTRVFLDIITREPPRIPGNPLTHQPVLRT